MTYYDKFYKIYQKEKKGQQVRKSDGGLYKEYLEYGLVDHIITVTKNAKESLINLFDIKEDRITVINNGIDMDNNSFETKDKTVLRKKYGFEENTTVIIFSGSINRRKGIQELVHVFENLCDKHHDIRLVLAGGGTIDDLLASVRRHWTKITFLGNVETDILYDFYRIADVGVLTSYTEQCSYSLIEMMAFRLPVIVTDIDGLSEMVTEGKEGHKVGISYSEKNGVVIDKTAYITSLNYLIENENERLEMGESVT